jgi:hypothetical protein
MMTAVQRAMINSNPRYRQPRAGTSPLRAGPEQHWLGTTDHTWSNHKTIGKIMDNHYKANGSSDQKHTGARWSKSLIKAIWDNMLQRWSQRNAVIYGNQIMSKQETQQQKLLTKVKDYYTYKDVLNIQDRSKLFTKDCAELLCEDP